VFIGKLDRFCVDRPQIFSGIAAPGGGHTWSLSPSLSSEGIRPSVPTIGDDASRHAADVIGRILSKASNGEMKSSELGKEYRQVLPKGPSLRTVLLLYHERFRLIDTAHSTFVAKLKTALPRDITRPSMVVTFPSTAINPAKEISHGEPVTSPVTQIMESAASSMSLVPSPSAPSSSTVLPAIVRVTTHINGVHLYPATDPPLSSFLPVEGLPPPYKEAVAVLPNRDTPSSDSSDSNDAGISLPLSIKDVNSDFKRSAATLSSSSSGLTSPISDLTGSAHKTGRKLLTLSGMPSHLLPITHDPLREIFQYLPTHIHHSIIKASNNDLRLLPHDENDQAAAVQLTEIQFQLGQLPMLKLSNDEFIDMLDLPHDWYDITHNGPFPHNGIVIIHNDACK
jgi:hypothetical protein